MASYSWQYADLLSVPSLTHFKRLFPDETSCLAHLEHTRWPSGFVCPSCGVKGAPFRFTSSPSLIQCRRCHSQTFLKVGTVLEQTHIPLVVWFSAAYLLANNSAGISTSEFRRQLGLNRYETAFRMLHKLRARMAVINAGPIGAPEGFVEVDVIQIDRGKCDDGRRSNHRMLIAAAVEFRRQNKTSMSGRQGAPQSTGRLRLQIIPNCGAEALCVFVRSNVRSGSAIIANHCNGHQHLAACGYKLISMAGRSGPSSLEAYSRIDQSVFSGLERRLRKCRHGVSPRYLQGYLNEFTFHFNRRFYRRELFSQLLGISLKPQSGADRKQ